MGNNFQTLTVIVSCALPLFSIGFLKHEHDNPLTIMVMIVTMATNVP